MAKKVIGQCKHCEKGIKEGNLNTVLLLCESEPPQYERLVDMYCRPCYKKLDFHDVKVFEKGTINVCELKMCDIFIHPTTGQTVQLQDQMYLWDGLVGQAHCAEPGKVFTKKGCCIALECPVQTRVKLVKRALEIDRDQLHAKLHAR